MTTIADFLKREREIMDRATAPPWYHDPESGNSSRFNWLHYADQHDANFVIHTRTSHATALKIIEELVKKLEKIEDPRKRDHQEPDKYTEVGCMMNMATEALELDVSKLEQGE